MSELKDLYAVGEQPPLGYVPRRCMPGWCGQSALASR